MRPVLFSSKKSFHGFTFKSPLCLIAALWLNSPLNGQTIYSPGGTLGASTTSNVGVGTAAPSAKLEVLGGTAVGLNDALWLSGGAGAYNSGSSLVFHDYFGSNPYPTWSLAELSAIYSNEQSSFGGALLFRTNSGTSVTDISEKMRIQPSGNVGIGTMTPNYKLTVDSGASSFSYRMHSAGDAIFALAGDGIAGTNLDLFSIRNNNTGVVAVNSVNGARLALGASSSPSAGSVTESMTLVASGNVGVGSVSPTHRLEVNGDGWYSKDSPYQMTVQNSSGGSYRTAGLDLRIDVVDLWQVMTDNSDQNKFFLQYNGATSSRFFCVDTSGRIGIGTTSPTQKLSVNGTIRAKEVIVDTAWSDYVFDDNYRLAPLSEVEAQIKNHKHLEGVPSAHEVTQGGIGLGQIEATLLAKIEELTLHQIEQEKKLTAQSREIQMLKAQIASVSK